MQNQMEHLYSKYHGCGHADMSKWYLTSLSLIGLTYREFISGVHRDSHASHLGHYSRLAYMAVAENESIAKTRFKLIEVGSVFG
jgi:splicing factor 3B subunit 5